MNDFSKFSLGQPPADLQELIYDYFIWWSDHASLGSNRPVFARPDLYTFDSAALSSAHVVHQVVPNHQHLQIQGKHKCQA